MDPLTVLGAAASVLQLAQAAISLSATLYAVGRALSSAKDDIESLANDLKTFSSNLTVLHRLLNDSKGLYTDDVYLLTSQIIQDCANLYGKISALLAKLGSTDKSRLKVSVKFVLKDGEFKKLLDRMRDLKVTLQNILVSLQLDLTINFILKDRVLQRQDDTALNPATIKALELAQSAAEDIVPLTKEAEEISKSLEVDPDDESIDSAQAHGASESAAIAPPSVQNIAPAASATDFSQTAEAPTPMMAVMRIMPSMPPAPGVGISAIPSPPAVTQPNEDQRGGIELEDHVSLSSTRSSGRLLSLAQQSDPPTDDKGIVRPPIVQKIISQFQIGQRLALDFEEIQIKAMLSGNVKQDRHRITLRHAAKALAGILREAAEEVESQFEFGSELLGEKYIKSIGKTADESKTAYELQETMSSIREGIIQPLKDYSSGKRKCDAAAIIKLTDGANTFRRAFVKLLDPLSEQWILMGEVLENLTSHNTIVKEPSLDELDILQDEIKDLAEKISIVKAQLFDLENPPDNYLPSRTNAEGSAAASLATVVMPEISKSRKGKWRFWKGQKTDPEVPKPKPKAPLRDCEISNNLRMDIKRMDSRKEKLEREFAIRRIRAVVPPSTLQEELTPAHAMGVFPFPGRLSFDEDVTLPTTASTWAQENTVKRAPEFSITPSFHPSARQYMDISSEVGYDSDSSNSCISSPTVEQLTSSNSTMQPWDPSSPPSRCPASPEESNNPGHRIRYKYKYVNGALIAVIPTTGEAYIKKEVAHGEVSAAASKTTQGSDSTAAETALSSFKIGPRVKITTPRPAPRHSRSSDSDRILVDEEFGSVGTLSGVEDSEEVPDLFRNSTLGMLEAKGGQDSSSDFSDDSNEQRYDNSYSDEMEYDEDPEDDEDSVSEDNSGHKFNLNGENHGMWAEVEFNLRAEDKESFEKFDEFLEITLPRTRNSRAEQRPIASSILDVMEALDKAIGLKSAGKVWAVVLCLLEVSKSPKASVSKIELFLENLKSIVSIVARYAVMENLFHQWEGVSIQESYRTALLNLGTLVLRFLVRAVLMWDGFETYSAEILNELATADVDADMACRKFSFVPEPTPTGGNGDDGENRQRPGFDAETAEAIEGEHIVP